MTTPIGGVLALRLSPSNKTRCDRFNLFNSTDLKYKFPGFDGSSRLDSFQAPFFARASYLQSLHLYLNSQGD